jgi:hypothetical protein
MKIAGAPGCPGNAVRGANRVLDLVLDRHLDVDGDVRDVDVDSVVDLAP